jgi:universal stress protein A
MTTLLAFRQILFPTDFSEASTPAGRTAADLARHFGARLHVLHVVPPVTDPTPAPAALRAAVAQFTGGLPVVSAIASGLPARQIVAYARKNAVDLIVVGTHGRTGVSRALLGSVAEAVVRHAACRVLAVPSTLYATVPAPTDLSLAEEALACLVCGAAVDEELVCTACRARIRGEALERKLREERPARGASAAGA